LRILDIQCSHGWDPIDTVGFVYLYPCGSPSSLHTTSASWSSQLVSHTFVLNPPRRGELNCKTCLANYWLITVACYPSHADSKNTVVINY